MMNNLEPQVGTVWGDWSTNWTGRRWVGQGRDETLIDTGTSTRTGVTQSIEVQTSRFSVGDRIVEVNFVPFMRTRLVEFEATRLKPGMTVYAFFDGVSVASYVKEGSYSYEPLVGINSVTAHPGGAGPLTTDANDMVSKVHHRMPVLLDASGVSLWLDQNNVDPLAHIQVVDNEALVVCAVSTKVNNSRNNGSELIEPIMLTQPEPVEELKLF